ncbi:hypothetical protein CCP2SC5_690004 [Azospirillaceae bacterium]
MSPSRAWSKGSVGCLNFKGACTGSMLLGLPGKVWCSTLTERVDGRASDLYSRNRR